MRGGGVRDHANPMGGANAKRQSLRRNTPSGWDQHVLLTAVVWSREQGHQLALGKEFVAILDDLMGSSDKVEAVLRQERLDNVLAESEGHTAVVLTPCLHVLLRIGPKQIAQQTGVRNVCGSVDLINLLHLLQIRRETAVTAEDLVGDDGGDREAVKAVCKGLPELDAVPAFAYSTGIWSAAAGAYWSVFGQSSLLGLARYVPMRLRAR